MTPENGWSIVDHHDRHGLVGGTTHDVRVRALVGVDPLLRLRRVVRDAEAELPELGDLIGDDGIQRVQEHPRDQLAHNAELKALVAYV
jgi:hypothetical protein